PILDGRDPLLGYRPAVDLLLEYEAGAAGQGLHLDDDVAELAMTARLLLVAPLLSHRFANGFAIAHGRRVGLHLDAVAALKTRDHGVEMLVVHAAQPNLVVRLVMLDDQRRVFFLQSVKGTRKLHVVLAVGGFDCDRTIARRIVDLDGRRQLSRAEPLAGFHCVDLGYGDDIAIASFAGLDRLFALHLEQRTDARVAAIFGFQVRALADLAAESASQG